MDDRNLVWFVRERCARVAPEVNMAGRMTVRPVSARLNAGGETIHVTVKKGAFYRCTELDLRPRNKSVQAVLEDIQARAKRGDGMRVGDMSWDGEGTPWFFEYCEKVPGQKRAEPDPDGDVLRDYESRTGVR